VALAHADARDLLRLLSTGAEALDLYLAARRAGPTVRSAVDRLVAACALRHRLAVPHRDRDFYALASISTLRA
jgi:predicted nucleic acid-binding protein